MYHKRNEPIEGYKVRAHPLYNVWTNMKGRCNNDKNKAYKNYGGRGIEVCERWHQFKYFVEDIGTRPEGYTLERINNDGNYEPTNCTWATRTEQCLNRRIFKNNTSGYTGIEVRPSGNYKARYSKNGKIYHLGHFKTAEEANDYRLTFIELLSNDVVKADGMTEKKVRLNSKTGIKGIGKHKDGYIVRIKGIYLGYSKTLDGAKGILENEQRRNNK